MHNPTLVLTKATKKQIISKEVDTIIRLGEINKWISSTVFNLKEYHLDENPIFIIITSSMKLKLTDLTNQDLRSSEFKSLNNFKKYWEDTLLSNWNSKTSVWLIKITPHIKTQTPNTDITDFFL